ncbi:MAG: type I DNA topoisomerase [Thermomicrobiales bacterium]
MPDEKIETKAPAKTTRTRTSTAAKAPAKKPVKRATTKAAASATKTTTTRRTATKAPAGGSRTRGASGGRYSMPPIAEGTRLVIVESPAKAKTITKYLGPGYAVRASMGHVRDLPDRGIGIDIEHDFAPTYVVTDDKTETVKQLKSAVKSASAVYLATDPDREGEAIAWHVVKATAPTRDKPVHRVTFHEITQDAVRAAIANPREIDMHLVDAQQARRVLDRIVGYRLSPFLWKKVTRGLSAGRVQSVALRLVVDREREIGAFVPVESWTVEADFAKIVGAGQERTPRDLFHARLTQINGKKADLKVQGDAQAVLDGLTGAGYAVKEVNKTERKRNAAPPFTTSTLQQEASRKHGYAVANTMRIAQQLYEGVKLSSKEGEVGLITYMRTDSLNVSDEAREAARRLIVSRYGGDFYPTKPNFYRTKAKGAQEAHEAIRPTDPARTPEDARPYLSPQQFNVYRLIWQRFIASQMAQAVFDVTQIDILGTPQQSDTAYTFRASGSVIRFPGFLEVYREGRDAGDGDDEIDKDALPTLTVNEIVDLVSLVPEQHWTQPPPRYTEASLVKALEELGIGRPSTYAPTIATILNRNYVTKDEKVLVPSELGTIVTDVLVKNFAEVVDYGFTSQMEERLDEVAEGTIAWVPLLRQFYGPFDANAKKAEADGSAVKGEQTDEICEVCGKPMVIRVSRYGRFLSCSGYPECKNTRPLEGSGAPPQYEKAPDEPTDDICPTCGKPMVVKTGRYGRFIACVDYPTCKTSKKIEVTTGVPCPLCGTGELVQRKTRKGNRLFWGCNRYPDCDYTTNTDPRKVAPAPVAMLAD